MGDRDHIRCIVDGCRNMEKDTDLTFYVIPANPERRVKWLKAIGRTDLLDNMYIRQMGYRVCSIHFENSDIFEVSIKRVLQHVTPSKYLSSDSYPPNNTRTVSTQTLDVYGNEWVNVKKEKQDYDDLPALTGGIKREIDDEPTASTSAEPGTGDPQEQQVAEKKMKLSEFPPN
ncbi:unnamed protein product, partial [Iphiclides podalirius]